MFSSIKVNGSLCTPPELMLFLTSHWDLRELRATFIIKCVFNNFLTYTAIFLNIVTMYAIQKTASLPKTLKNLSFSIAISDVGFGLLAQPVYSSLLVKWLQLNHPSCNNYGVFSISANLFLASSFLSVVAVSVDRFLAVHLHLRYQELVTHRRVVIVVISIWVLNAFVSFTMFWELRGTRDYTDQLSHFSLWFYYLICGVHKDVFNNSTAQESDSVLASCRQSSVWNNDKLCCRC